MGVVNACPPASGLLGESLVKNQLGKGSWLDIYSPRWWPLLVFMTEFYVKGDTEAKGLKCIGMKPAHF